MSKFDQNWKMVDFQNEFKRLKISYGGKKVDLIKLLLKNYKIVNSLKHRLLLHVLSFENLR